MVPAGVPYEFDVGGDPLGVIYLEPDVAGADALAVLACGGEAVSGDLGRATWAVLGLGLLTGLPLLWVAMRQKPEKGNP